MRWVGPKCDFTLSDDSGPRSTPRVPEPSQTAKTASRYPTADTDFAMLKVPLAPLTFTDALTRRSRRVTPAIRASVAEKANSRREGAIKGGNGIGCERFFANYGEKWLPPAPRRWSGSSGRLSAEWRSGAPA